MEHYYGFAGMELVIRIPDERIYTEERQLAPFRIAKVTEPHCFEFEVVDALAAPEGTEIVALPSLREYRLGDLSQRYIGSVKDGWETAYIRTERRGANHRVQLLAAQILNRIGIKTVLNSKEAEHLVLENNGVVSHSAFIEWEGKGILFTAPSGTGKSTQAELWQRFRGAEIINGDRAAVRLAEGKILAEGIPYSGSSQYCENRSLPLEAIVYLGQAPQTSIRKMGGYEAFSRIWEGISVNTWDREDMERASTVVQRIVERIPVFYMPCTPDESAVIALEQELRKLETL